LEVFDLCDTTRSSPQRNVTTVPTQALTLFNSEFIVQQATHLARRLRAEAGDDPDEQIDLAWRLALCRLPTADEAAAMRQFLADEIRQLRSERGDAASEPELADEALRQFCRVLFNLNEFVYPD
jgi:hypothetical protein